MFAAKFTDPLSYAVLRAMAIVWADLAEQVERREAGDNESPHHTQPAESPKRGHKPEVQDHLRHNPGGGPALAAENLNVSVSHIYQSNRGVNGATWAREDIAAAFAEHISREFHDHARTIRDAPAACL